MKGRGEHSTGLGSIGREHARRSRARRIALEVLYQLDVSGSDPGPEHREYVARRARGRSRGGNAQAAPEPAVEESAWRLIEGCRHHLAELDALIAAHARNWSMERMAPIDRNVLRLGTYELLHEKDTPPKVAIDEAVRLAERYGASESGAFVNGVLDAIMKERARRG